MNGNESPAVGGARTRPSLLRLAILGIATLVLVGGFLSLGTWQVHRRAWKLDLIGRVNARVHAPPIPAPVPAPDAAQWPTVTAANDEYRHVTLTGTYLYDKDTQVQAVTDLGGGFWVLTPMRTDDGKLVLVNRGFVPPGWKENVSADANGPTTVTGLLRMPEPGGGFLQKNAPSKNLWYSRDVQAIAMARGLGQVAPYFIDADGPGSHGATAGNPPPRYPVGGLTVIRFPNNHLMYAITWYALALMSAAAGVFVIRMEWRNRRSYGNCQGRSIAPWSLAFRPFFLATSLWSALALALWIGLFMTGASLPSRFAPLSWHIHAMLFGFVPAAIAGFMLTAIPNWTGRPPIQGVALAGLAGLWLLGRITVSISAFLPLWVAAVLDLAFPFALCAVALREIVAARNWRNLMMPISIAVLGIADLLTYLELAGAGLPAGLGWRLAIAAVIALITAIGGRIIPPFTRNWLKKHGVPTLPADHGLLDRMALATLHTGLLGWAFLPASRLIGGLLLLAAALNLCRLARWRGFATVSEPLLAILHVGYAWTILGAALLGARLLTNIVPAAAAIHALTAGAMGTMVLAIMTRVSRGHTGRPLEADGATTLMYATMTAAGLTRVAAAFATASSMILLDISALLWVTSFLLFAFVYGPMLVSPRVDGGRPQ